MATELSFTLFGYFMHCRIEVGDAFPLAVPDLDLIMTK